MNDKTIPNHEIDRAIAALKVTDLPPTQVECIERALRAGTSHDAQALLALVTDQVVHEHRFAKALLDWFTTSQSAAERISLALETAAHQMEDELLKEILSKDGVL